MKIPFDIKFKAQIESGEYKVETRDGVRVKLLPINSHNARPIIGELELNGKTVYISTDENGSWTEGNGENKFDLFIITPEPELTEFEQQIENLLNLALPEGHAGTTIKNTKRVSAELLKLAKDEIYSHESLVDYAKRAKAKGKAEALKDLPRWKKAYDHCFVGPAIMRDESGFYHASTTKPGCRYITYASLSALPGFKED